MELTSPSKDPVEAESGAPDCLDPEQERRLVWKIDLHFMPLLIITYALQFVDKTSLAYGAILGIREDLNLVGQEFSWASSIFYIGYLTASYLICLGFVKFPIGKYLTVLVFLWGITLTLHTAVQSYAGLMVARTFLGVFESAVSPGFSLITGMWYTPKEHVSRHAFWFAGDASGSIIGSMVAYGVLHYGGGFAQWKILFLIFGLITVAWSGVLWLFLADSPSTARFLTPAERVFASLRPKKFQKTTQTKKWDRAQFIETVKDFKSWWFLAYTFLVSVPNGGLTSFSTLIINGMGYDKYRTILMTMAGYGFSLVAVVVATFFTTIIRRSRLFTMSILLLVAIAGVLMVKLIPEERKLSRLAGLWLIKANTPTFPLVLSLSASNVAGFTKKSTVVAMVFIGYCVGNFIGPQFFIATEAPHYSTAFTTILACYAIAACLSAILRGYLMWENRRRDREQGVHVDPEDSRFVDLSIDEGLKDVDETDIQNRSFRYVL